MDPDTSDGESVKNSYYLIPAENFAPGAENVLRWLNRRTIFYTWVGKVLQKASWEEPQILFPYNLLHLFQK